MSTPDPHAFNAPFVRFDVTSALSPFRAPGLAPSFPKSPAAKLVVCAEIVVGYFLTVTLASSFAGLALQKATRKAASQNPKSE